MNIMKEREGEREREREKVYLKKQVMFLEFTSDRTYQTVVYTD